MIDNFQREQNELLEYILDIYFKNYWTESFINSSLSESGIDKGLELFITPVCNQKCEYCYLVKHGKDLYPSDIRDSKQILKNLTILLDYLLDKKVVLPRMDLFSGEIWGMEFGNNILDIILKYLKKGLKIREIMIPSNCSFLVDARIATVMDNYIKLYKEAGTALMFSASVDGMIVEHLNRPFKNGTTEDLKNDKYYDRLLKFMFDHSFGFHPMISADTIKYQCANYIWWHSQFKKFNKDNLEDWYGSTMFLEVRNNNWTTENIIDYLKWLNFMMDYDLDTLWNGNITDYLNYIILGEGIIKYKDGRPYKPAVNFNREVLSYNPINASINTSKDLTCTAGSYISIRLGDLSIIPCHRTAYPKFIYGQFNVEDNKISGVSANNPFLMFNVLFQGTSTFLKCDYCAIKDYCPKGCLGSQFETTSDPYYPIQSVCDFYFARAIFMYYKVKQYIDNNNLEATYDFIKPSIFKIFNLIEEKNPEEIEKWQSLIQTII